MVGVRVRSPLPTKENSRWLSRLTDVEGRLAKHILDALRTQAQYDAKSCVTMAGNHVHHSFYSLIAVAVIIFSHGIVMSVALYQTIQIWYFYLSPINDLMSILFKDLYVPEPVLAMILLDALRRMLVGFIVIITTVYIIGFFIMWQGDGKRYSMAFGVMRILNSMFMITLVGLVILLQNKDDVAKSLLGHVALHGLDGNRFNSYDVIQHELQCCGFHSTGSDWHDSLLLNWSEPFSKTKVELINRYEFQTHCQYKDEICKIPESCCIDYNPRNLSLYPLQCDRRSAPGNQRFKTKGHDPSHTHPLGCVHLLSGMLFYWWLTSIFTLAYSLIVTLATTYLSTNIICNIDGLGIVDPISELPVCKQTGLKLANGLDAPNIKHSIFTMKSIIDNNRNYEDVLHEAVQGKRNHHLDSEDSSESI